MQPGLIVAPNLKLVRALGKGGMGTVWVAEHLGLGREVAVKFLSDELAQDRHAVARFEREAHAVAELENEHVVKVIEYGVTDRKLPYMATDLLEGEDLGALLVRERRIEPSTAAEILDQLCDGLGAAHRLGIVHRDIKPDNVFLVKSDGPLSVCLLDFGIAKHWQEPKLDVTSTGIVVGTPHYMSPEQFLSAKHVDYRADLWSLGVLLYRALTGRLPFEATSFAALCIQIHRGLFPRPTAYRADLPSSLNTWFAKALRGHPAARFTSAIQMAESFRAAIEDEAAVSAKPLPSRRVPPADWARGDPALDPKDVRLASSGGGDAITVALGMSEAAQATTAPELSESKEVLPRPRSKKLPALLIGSLSLVLAGLIYPGGRAPERPLAPPSGHRELGPLQESSSEAPNSTEIVEVPPVRIVSGRVSAVTWAGKKTASTPAAPSPPREPDRGF